MEPMSLGEILEAVHGRMLGDFDQLDQVVPRVETDSRTIHENALFVPLVGDRFDGHAYINAALEGGAGGCFTQRERESYLPGKYYIKVESTQRALRDLAKYYKRKFPIPIVALTGSVGKTTTKDMVAAVLGERYQVLKTEGNLNNDVGVPMTLLRLNQSHQLAVLELGMNHAGEIDYLSNLVEPDVALITNVGDSHIEFFGSREKILQAKSEIFHHAKPDAFVVLNGDDPLLRTLSLPHTVMWCGRNENNSYRADQVESDGRSRMTCQVTTPKGSYPVQIPALGEHMIYPTLMAAAVGEHFGLTQQEITDGILHFAPTKMRMNILHRQEDITILNDTYNANPQSMRAAVEVLANTKGDYKVAVLGDMFELGPLAAGLHAGVGKFLGQAGIDCLVAVGDLAKHIYDAAQSAPVPECYYCATKEEAKPILDQVVKPHATILVKASRGMAFEDLVEYLKSKTKEIPAS
ncbi:MAG: UDP-N-acetylmuramoyl-tripeptide--D-alanyl-D-alanine ligase [Oscillospiraceae bacterium]|nr:UDP-N-acetylmuramoyl-tripeptide--D-alanyl-D-alanine ligase [Oscillospiraceae bacterium]